jgi:hypothetical protein
MKILEQYSKNIQDILQCSNTEFEHFKSVMSFVHTNFFISTQSLIDAEYLDSVLSLFFVYHHKISPSVKKSFLTSLLLNGYFTNTFFNCEAQVTFLNIIVKNFSCTYLNERDIELIYLLTCTPNYLPGDSNLLQSDFSLYKDFCSFFEPIKANNIYIIYNMSPSTIRCRRVTIAEESYVNVSEVFDYFYKNSLNILDENLALLYKDKLHFLMDLIYKKKFKLPFFKV